VSEQTGLNGGNGAGQAENGRDSVLGFTMPERDARGRLVRMGPTLTAILAAHDYPAPLGHLLGEALVLTVLLGTTLQKDGGQMTLQAQASGGPVDLVVCDYRAGAVRGYLRFDPKQASAVELGAPLAALFSKGYLAITLDQTAARERYQGIVPLEGASLSEAVEHYFSGSEQVETLIRTAVAPTQDGGWSAGGLLVQHLPKGETGGPRLSARTDKAEDWAHVAALAGTVTNEELADSALEHETLLWRLFHEDEVRVFKPLHLARGCRCSPQHVRDVLMRFPAEELDAMRDENGLVVVNCEFCARKFPIDF
jgi:molecular chaperone Hsp33